ncbi:bifunctional pyridoxamine 5'-phosphate oxidase family protein/GNAT family N-acetyltransferase [Symbioplanes lichenis]|uniref:bifunctional pyridoxamine 5'-phosphate oxidase family protein/GNAT family N-acetyltransferase n=1 Tax=Symbioplanes lichenis TaxID=1629072 RepID=UPI0027396EAA|nr:bifunctional pyridoxamine 5'-phosphate oxidase family protein/GNAT family N-acetyltransferase [Actinoplanes lichenis]
MTDLYEPTSRTTATRNRGRMHYDRARAHAILDEAYDCSVAFVVDGQPRALPTLHVRVGETLYLHASTGGRLGLIAREGGASVCVSVTLLDGLVFARSQFNHSANYRSLVALGTARLVTNDTEKSAAMTALVEKTGPGRAAESRPPTTREMASTAVLALPLTEVSVRVRAGDVIDEPEDEGLPHWAGVLPMRTVAGPPGPAAGVRQPTPFYLAGAPASPWHTAAPLRGRHVALEPLAPSHVDGLLTALADDEVWQFLPSPRPQERAAMAELVEQAERERWAGQRVAWAQCDPHTGEVLGMTSYHDIDPARRALGIGHTVLGRRWWRTGVNTEAKLLLLERAFEQLGAERVFWYTDIRNERSQRAIARLGASRDGLIRRHRLRPDGTWRDSVLFAMTREEWPGARERLEARLAAGGGASE